MPRESLGTFLRRLTRGMVAETLADQVDRQLVERFLADRSEAVFEALVRRHGPMVYRVCWRVLQQEQDAEDAFQATFLLLAQNLRGLRKQTSLASFLHGIAQRVALKARSQAAARRRHEQQAPVSPPARPEEVSWEELRAALDAEIAQMADKWRLPLILCYLEGRTQDEAAEQLGWSKSTLRRRLDEARAALGRRLSQRGVWPAALSATLLSDCVANALPPPLVVGTVEAAARVVAGQAADLPAQILALTQGVPLSMSRTTIHKALAFLLAVGSLAIVAGLSMSSAAPKSPRPSEQRKGSAPATRAQRKPAPKPQPAQKPDIYVIASANLYEVDEAFYKRLTKAKWSSKADLEKLEQEVLESPKKQEPADALFKLLDEQKPLRTGKKIDFVLGQEEVLLSWIKSRDLLPSPEQRRKGQKGPQRIQEGVTLRTRMTISADRRYVRAQFTEKSSEVEGVETVKVLLDDDKEADADVAFLKEMTASSARIIPDGGSLLIPLHCRPQAAREKGRWLVAKITPQIYIEEEERERRRGR